MLYYGLITGKKYRTLKDARKSGEPFMMLKTSLSVDELNDIILEDSCVC